MYKCGSQPQLLQQSHTWTSFLVWFLSAPTDRPHPGSWCLNSQPEQKQTRRVEQTDAARQFTVVETINSCLGLVRIC